MSVEFRDKRLVLRDAVGFDDAQLLRECLQAEPGAAVDLSACTYLHAASLQVLLAARASVSAWPADADLARWLQSTFLANG